ncbi:MAG: GUN4 domain-containing protein [Bacteroidota bacterium]
MKNPKRHPKRPEKINVTQSVNQAEKSTIIGIQQNITQLPTPKNKVSKSIILVTAISFAVALMTGTAVLIKNSQSSIPDNQNDISNNSNLTISSSASLSDLENALKLSNLPEANYLTSDIYYSLLMKYRYNDGRISASERDSICNNVIEISNLWEKYTSSRFGFRVQADAWVRILDAYPVKTNLTKSDRQAIEKLWGKELGWSDRGANHPTFDMTAPLGHLPVVFIQNLRPDFRQEVEGQAEENPNLKIQPHFWIKECFRHE